VGGSQAYPAAFSVDLEDYYHAELIRRRGLRDGLPPRVEESASPLLEIIERLGIRATFFIVGEVIRSAPRLIERLVKGGHEIGCHTYTHRPLWNMSPEEFRVELRRFKDDLRETAGPVEVRGFRAPTFSLDASTQWALPVLAQEGFTYDSSVVPVRGPLYGCPGAPLGLYRPAPDDLRRDDAGGALVEFPAPVATLAGKRLPIGGGFYLRALPFVLYQRLVRKVLARRPFFLYVHPWETDAAIPRLDLPRWERWATYTGIAGALGKVERLIRGIRFTTMRAAIESSGFGV
jgi:polysaccharide deacetylase family protein (PEP-CTERM system associated)